MHLLSNDQLEVSILDPKQDRDRFGTRYCTGGYVFQVTDHDVGALLSSPTYPASFNPFDGQGLPESFRRAPIRDPGHPDRGQVIGVGLCDLTAERVLELCSWRIRADGDRISMETTQSIGDYAVDLKRVVALHERTVRSTTTLTNNGALGFQIVWFPHPFFPQPETSELCRLNIPITLRENDGYVLAPSGFITRKDDPWTTDHYLALDHEARSPVTILQRHPKVGLIAASTDYVPRFFPIWGNENTISWEPYYETRIAPGQTLNWSIAYDF